jgi:hypothetical protein
MKLDAKRREYEIIVIGEEPHPAYNRVGLTSFFQHRQVENLYLNPREWVGGSTTQAKELIELTLSFCESTQAVRKACLTTTSIHLSRQSIPS